jgi:hypothetical protein
MKDTETASGGGWCPFLPISKTPEDRNMLNEGVSFHPYLGLIGKLCGSGVFTGAVVAAVFGYFVSDVGWITRIFGISAVAISGYVAYLFFSHALSNIKDIRAGKTVMTGTVTDKYADQTPSRNYKITIEGVSFEVSRSIYDWLSTGDEVHISYWPNTKKLYRVDK